ncbi:filamentous hemagglutinin N-terminal domain-containing protein [Achromobacter sp. Marseille-Q0513]|uniref:two-partner secretion domain-containing protein n=1 Tax=Achromobacter sp. Marseille-Q0513 TaxID=2829161 RepID=UPI001BA3D3AA|nr:GLUG motif-containing protein [Achromobacter sp. Marseille-Q0513]MBR8654105.1 filamentous hemagglutinin N-terminal domain-containing protein [Achromobacter sp. Marseille-Q0513]
MNKTHTVIWNASKACWTVASECARRRGKSGVSGARAVLAAVAAAGLSALAPQALAAPTNGTVTHGSAFIWQDNPGNVAGQPKNTVISQTTSKAVINWNTFDVAGNESVTFNHMDPSHMTLNNITSLAPSNIAGAINAVGKVFLVNPNGIVFNNTAQVNVGSLVASTHATDPTAFFNNTSGVFNFDAPAGQNTMVSNVGYITSASGGDIVLLGHRVHNGGSIQTNGGSVALGGAGSFTLRLGNGPLSLSANTSGQFANAQNTAMGTIQANGGQVLLMARDAQPANPLLAVVNNAGLIEAGTLQARQGRIVLDGGSGTVLAGGRMSASALGTYGDGGSVSIQGGHVRVLAGAQVDTRASNGSTGTLEIRGDALKVGESAATAGNILASTLANTLNTTNVSLASNAGDVEVNAPVSWSSGHALTLDASHGSGGKVAVNGALTASGAGAALNLSADRQIDISQRITLSGVSNQLHLRTTQSGTPGLAPTANYVLNGPAGQAAISLSGANPLFTSNGLRHVVIQDLAQLNAVNGNLSGYYVLGSDIRGGGTVQSIGAGQGGFKGLFDGLGNKLVNLTVQNPDSVAGLFSDSSGTLRNLILDNVSGTGSQHIYSGTLIGRNTGTISNVHVVNGRRFGSEVQGGALGGMVGFNNGGTIERSSYSGSVNTSPQIYVAGGLVGLNVNGTIRDSSSKGSVNDYAGHGTNVAHLGGLVGINRNGMINNSASTASVTTKQQSNIGGLVGTNSGQIIASTSSGRVSNTSGGNVGGLVGENTGVILDSSQTVGEVEGSGLASVGGLVGLNGNGGMIDRTTSSSAKVYLAGSTASVGGLVGLNAAGATISNSEAVGNGVLATNTTGVRIGGLVGVNDGDIQQSASRVREVKGGGGASAGGLVGRNTGNIFASESSTLLTESGNNSHAGGVIGYNEGRLMATVSSGRVAAGSYSNVGGLVGTNGEPGKVHHSESSGSLAGRTGCSANNNSCPGVSQQVTMGGLVGLNRGLVSGSATSNAFYTYDASRTGGLVGMNQGVMQYNTARDGAAQLRPAGTNQGIIEP